MHFSTRSIITAAAFLILSALPAIAANWDRGVSMYNKGDFRGALAEFQEIVRERPDAAGAWYYIGLCEFKLNRYKRVDLPLSHAIDLLGVQSPASTNIEGAWYTIGFSHYLLADYAGAIDPLLRYRELAAKGGRSVDPNATRALARAYFFLERYDEALPLLAANPPNSAPAETNTDFYYQGLIYFKRGDDDRAIASLQEAVKAKADDAAALELLANSLMRRARKGNSKADWLRAADAGEKLLAVRDDLKTANLLGLAYLGGGQFDKAVAPFEKLAKANRDDGQAWLYYGISLSRSGSVRKAMEALEITIQITPDSIPALSELAYVYESDKQYQQALRVYEKAYAASGSNDPSIKQSIDRVRALASQQQ
ncbi:MAG TPA: tetratricopeptide repeat protein [Blastocatellia bacterium]|nr:tetratricopeptide repeat protein [Blastocatellia bacterium]